MVGTENIELMDVGAGEMIVDVAKRAAAIAADHACPVGFEFNSTFVIIRPGEPYGVALTMWDEKRRGQYGQGGSF